MFFILRIIESHWLRWQIKGGKEKPHLRDRRIPSKLGTRMGSSTKRRGRAINYSFRRPHLAPFLPAPSVRAFPRLTNERGYH